MTAPPTPPPASFAHRWPPPPPHSSAPPLPPTSEQRPGPRPDTARTAALWLGGAGAFLLLVAAGVLLALRWDDIGAWAKVAGLVAVNGGILALGQRVARSLPATGRALDYLGTLLLPMSAVGVGLQLGLAGGLTVLVASAVTAGGALLVARQRQVPPLPWLAVGAVIPAAGGLAALTDIAPGLLLGLASLGATAAAPTRRHLLWVGAILWAASASSLALVASVQDPLISTGDVMSALGLSVDGAWWVHVGTGLLAAISLGLLATRDDDEVLAIAALTAAIGGVATAVAQDGGSGFGVLTQAIAIAAAVELAAYAAASARPWGRVLAGTAAVAEVGMLVATMAVLGPAGEIAAGNQPANAALAASGWILAAGWFVADYRRRARDCQSFGFALLTGGGWWPATALMAAAVLIALAAMGVAVSTISVVATVMAFLGVLSGRAGGHITAVGLTAVALIAAPTGWVGLGIAAATAASLAWAGSLRWSSPPAPAESFGLLLAAFVAWLTGLAALAPELDAELSWVLLITGGALLILIVERAHTDPVAARVGLIGRVLLVVPFLPTLVTSVDGDQRWAAVLLGALVVADYWRSGDARLGIPAIAVAPIVTTLVLDSLEMTRGQTGVCLALIAVATTGMTTLLHPRRMLAAVPVVYAWTALLFAAPFASPFSTVVMLLGGATLVAAIDRERWDLFVAGWLITTAGLWLRLGLADIEWSEVYLAPIAALLVLAGVVFTPVGVRSWKTHGVAVTLLGGAALLERVAGGPGGHALLAGVVAVVAIVAGARRRLIGPLATGTALLVAVAAHESLSYTASLPTWAWLAAGGAVLLAAGVITERTATSPLDSGRKALESVRDNFR